MGLGVLPYLVACPGVKLGRHAHALHLRRGGGGAVCAACRRSSIACRSRACWAATTPDWYASLILARATVNAW